MIYFPAWFMPDMNTVQHYRDLLLERIRLAVEGEAPQINRIMKWFYEQSKTYNFNPHDDGNALIEIEKGFQQMVAMMEESGIIHAAELTEYEFYNRIEYLEKKAKQTQQYASKRV